MSSDRSCTLIVFCPLAFERAGIERAMRAAWSRAGRLPNNTTRFIQTGPGPDAVRRAVEQAAHDGAISDARRQGQSVIAALAGVAGELMSSSAGARLFTEVIDANEQTWRSPLTQPGGTFSERILGLDTPAYTADEKAAWRERSGATLVDTESHAFADTCERLRIPWLIVRAASDRRHESLPLFSSSWVDARGRTRLSRVLRDLVRNPALIAPLIRLGRRGSIATRLVGGRLARLVAEELDPHGRATNPVPHSPGPAAAPITPVPADVLNAPLLILFGGSFDPPHAAHVELPRLAREELERRHGCPNRAFLVYIPAARSPHKPGAPSASDEHRIEMLRVALDSVERTFIWTDEVDRSRFTAETSHAISASSPPTPSYTIHTVERLRSLADMRCTARSDSPAPIFRLLIGADQARAFHRWKDAARLLALAEPAVMPRAPASIETHETADAMPQSDITKTLIRDLANTGAWDEESLRAWRARVLALPVMRHRSTDVRNTLASVVGPAAATNQTNPTTPDPLLNPRVADYIKTHGIYRKNEPCSDKS